jgi:hypothetical protein
MRVAVVSDIHGKVTALDAVVADLKQARPINDVNSAVASWRTDASVLAWLEAL